MDTLIYNWDLDGDGDYDDFEGTNGSFDLSTIGLTQDTLLTLGVQVYDGDDYSTRAFQVQTTNVVPEPTTFALQAAGAGLLLRRRRR